MILSAVHRYTSSVGTIDRREVYRYLGCGRKEPDRSIVNSVDTVCRKIEEQFLLEAVWVRLPLSEGYDFGLGRAGKSLSANLKGCGEIFLFAATLGLEADRTIRREESLSQARGVIADAAFSAAVEAGCNQLNAYFAEIAGDGKYLRPRFSPGYGDFPLALQSAILEMLSANQLLGLTLTDSLLMLPTKSVSALVGISDTPKRCHLSCESCESAECPYRI